MADLEWTTYSPQQPFKRKRAEAACAVCHSKKIRCNYQARKAEGHHACSACAAAGNTCQPRISKRERDRQHQQPENNDDRASPRERLKSSHRIQRTGSSATTQLNTQNSSDFGETSENDTNQTIVSGASVSIPGSAHTLHQSQLSEPPASVSPHTASRTEQANMSSFVLDGGFMNVYGPEQIHDATRPEPVVEHTMDPPGLIRPELLQSFAETYFEYCYPWCPVLDKADLFDDLKESPLLTDALALVGSHIQPPIYDYTHPSEYYERARRRFYDDEEGDVIVSLRAVALFYWWSVRSPARVHRHSSWWWTSVIIRHAQQLGVHRELSLPSDLSPRELGLRRRLWWTAFARERLTAVCQGKPCIINPEECNIKDISLDDFPPDADQAKAEIFIYWVRLCGVIGKVAKYLHKVSSSNNISQAEHPGKELVGWINSLPLQMRLPIASNRTINFNRDVYQLHLPYLAVVIVLHLKRSNGSLPIASSTAILAATCVARIYKDILIRGQARFLMAINCWYTATAFIALAYAATRADLKSMVGEELDILYAVIKELQKMWGTANVFEQGFRRLRATLPGLQVEPLETDATSQASQTANNKEDGDMNWLDSFPFASSETSPIANALFATQDGVLDLFAEFPDDFITLLYPELLEPLDDNSFINIEV